MKRLALVFVLAFVLGILAERWHFKAHREPIKEIHDTTFVEVVKTEIKPVYVEKRVVDTMLVPVVDTLRIHDTTFVQIPREEKVYSDSLYYAVVSGYRPSLDTISVYSKERVITNYVETVTHSRWGIGIQAGYGASREGLSPYIGVGVSYNIITW